MERQRIWLSLSLFALGMVCLGQDNTFAKSRFERPRYPAYKSRPVVPVRVQPHAVALAPAPKCSELSQTSCGLVTTSRLSHCQEFWYTHLQAETESACADAAANDPNFSDYVVCGRLYRNHQQFETSGDGRNPASAALTFAKQYGGKILAKGSCAPMPNLPMCNQIAPIPAGGYCRCPAGSVTAVAGCEPNETNTSCLSMSIANQCEG
jgi:hypothetical protein